jgi:hypothetical protein
VSLGKRFEKNESFIRPAIAASDLLRPGAGMARRCCGLQFRAAQLCRRAKHDPEKLAPSLDKIMRAIKKVGALPTAL